MAAERLAPGSASKLLWRPAMRSTLVRSLVPLFLVAALATPAAAGKKAGVTMPDSIQVSGKTLNLNGMGVREATMLKVDVYVAGLYVEHVSSDPAAIVGSADTKRLVLKFVRDVDKEDITDAWKEGFKKNSTVSAASLKSDIDKLNGWMGNFAEGDTLTFTFLPDKGVQVDIGKSRKGTIAGDDFSRSLLSIWLGKKPPNGGLKKGLLGKH